MRALLVAIISVSRITLRLGGSYRARVVALMIGGMLAPMACIGGASRSAAPAVVHVVFHNPTAGDVYLGRCGFAVLTVLERSEGDHWRPIEYEQCFAVLVQPVIVPPKAPYAFNVTLGPWSSTAAPEDRVGTFRFVLAAYRTRSAARERDTSELLPAEARTTGTFTLTR
jgi:hypothetical protein